jgi:membrane associated rhomboid family serine protease
VDRLLDNWLRAFQLIMCLVSLIWCVALINHIFDYRLNALGIYPRDLDGLIGILLWSLLHGDFSHLAMNTMPLIFLGFFVALRGPVLFFKISLLVWLLAGVLVWLLGRPAIHLGASGLIFGYFGFILAVAVYERSLWDLSVASVTMFYYGGLFFGVLPLQAFISWEAHLAGLATGILAARLFGKDWAATPIR